MRKHMEKAAQLWRHVSIPAFAHAQKQLSKLDQAAQLGLNLSISASAHAY
jgi:hypothetical protein